MRVSITFPSICIQYVQITSLFPYTTLFRTLHGQAADVRLVDDGLVVGDARRPVQVPVEVRVHHHRARHETRSEEHTSELQSLRHLVCRHLLEKKKKDHTTLYKISP